jgi:hypothetical protein
MAPIKPAPRHTKLNPEQQNSMNADGNLPDLPEKMAPRWAEQFHCPHFRRCTYIQLDIDRAMLVACKGPERYGLL